MEFLKAAPSLDSITAEVLRLLDDEVLADLRTEDPSTAIELHFSPLRVRALPAAAVAEGGCSTDGYYECELDPDCPWILFARDVAESRVRFTLLHELCHHLLATRGAFLLDDLDRLAGPLGDPAQLEESICHRFAGRILVPDDLVNEAWRSGPLRPADIAKIKEQTNASWEAVAVRVVDRATTKSVVILVRNPGTIAFAAASSRMEWSWWPRDSAVAPAGPLAGALDYQVRAKPETYRYGLGHAERMFCDTLPISERLAIAVLADRASDCHFEILEQPEPAWREREEFCVSCGDERSVGWCDRCRGQLCVGCRRCGCALVLDNPVCLACGLKSPFRPGAGVCRTCEADGLS